MSGSVVLGSDVIAAALRGRFFIFKEPAASGPSGLAAAAAAKSDTASEAAGIPFGAAFHFRERKAMTHNPDGSITLTAEEAREIDALLARPLFSIADRRVRDIRVYTNWDATRFAREWTFCRDPELTH